MINSTCSSINVSHTVRSHSLSSSPYFSSGIDYKAFDKQEQSKAGDIVLLKKRATLDCRYPLERYEIGEIVYELGRIKDPITGRRCNGLRYLDEPFIAADRQRQLTRTSPPPMKLLPNE